MLCDCVGVFRCHTKKISVARITQFHGIEKTSMAKMTRSANHDHEVMNFFSAIFVLVSFLCRCRCVVSVSWRPTRGRFLQRKIGLETCFIFWDEYDGTQHFYVGRQ